MIGIGGMLGAGIFVVTGTLTRDIAGPGIILSYIFAGFSAFLAALCYAEFGVKIPKAGSAYSYTYLVMGELPAFLVGWNMVLEMIIGTASVAKASSGSLDSLLNGKISNVTKEYVGSFKSPWMSEYPDFVAMIFLIFWSIFVAIGVNVSSMINNILTILNISILVALVGCGIYFADTSNWTNESQGGFLPYGFSGVMAGTASCFYSYSGFEVVTTAAEESKNPSKHIPIALTLALICVTLLYVAASCALTLMVPYLHVDILAPFPAALQYHHFTWGKRVIAIGALVGLSASLLSSMYAMPRTAYAIASDGLLFKPLAKVNGKTKTPLTAIIIFSLITAVLTTFANLKTLVELLSIGTLLCLIIVAINVIILRYQPEQLETFVTKFNGYVSQNNENQNNDTQQLIEKEQNDIEIGAVKKQFAWISCLKRIPKGSVAPISVTLMIIFSSCITLIVLHAPKLLTKWWMVLILCILSICFLASFLLLFAHQQNTNSHTFQVPLVPFVPVLSMLINTYLILNLNYWTWIRLVIWFIIGFIIYFGYGIRHSEEKQKLLKTNNSVHYKPLLNAEEESVETTTFVIADDSK